MAVPVRYRHYSNIRGNILFSQRATSESIIIELLLSLLQLIETRSNFLSTYQVRFSTYDIMVSDYSCDFKIPAKLQVERELRSENPSQI